MSHFSWEILHSLLPFSNSESSFFGDCSQGRFIKFNLNSTSALPSGNWGTVCVHVLFFVYMSEVYIFYRVCNIVVNLTYFGKLHMSETRYIQTRSPECGPRFYHSTF